MPPMPTKIMANMRSTSAKTPGKSPVGSETPRTSSRITRPRYMVAIASAGACRVCSSEGPPGTRTSLYQNPSYLSAAKAFAPITIASIDSVDPEHATLNPVPYVGIQYVDIPQFESLGLTVAQQIAGAIAGTESVSQALQAGQSAASQYTAAQLSGSG